mgnify:CR=1 FL=1
MGDPVRLCHALVIGVDRYEEGSADLSGCVAGARALAGAAPSVSEAPSRSSSATRPSTSVKARNASAADTAID